MNTGFFPVMQVIKNNRSWLIISLLIFALGFFSFMGNNLASGQEQGEIINQEMMVFLEQIVEFIEESHPLMGSLLIFLNNLVSSLQMLFLGVILGISPLLTLLVNGAVLGTVSVQVLGEGASPWFLVAGIVPHGIPELAAFFICSALGLKIGYHTIISPLPDKSRKQSFKFIWKEIISVLPLVVVLLFIAAVIEIYITKNLLTSFL